MLYTELAKLVFKPEEVQDVTIKDLIKKIPSSGRVLREPKDIDLGFAVKEEISKCSSEDNLSKNDVLIFRTQCREMVVRILQKLQENSPLKNKILRGFSFLDPSLIGQQICISRLNLSLENLFGHGWFGGDVADCIKDAFLKMSKDPRVTARAAEFDRKKKRLDEFWIPLMKECEAPEVLDNFVRKILILSHGQAAVERGFNINKETIVENQLEESLIAQRRVFDSIRNLDIASLEISQKMIRMVRGSCRRQKEALALRREQKSEEEKRETDRKRVVRELAIKEMEKKRLIAQTGDVICQLDNEIADLRKQTKLA